MHLNLFVIVRIAASLNIVLTAEVGVACVVCNYAKLFGIPTILV